MEEVILILDFGGQYNQLIARRVRELNVYSMIKPYSISVEEIKKIHPKGIIFTGGPNSIYEDNSPKCDKEIFNLGIPILGICYGMQFMAFSLGGKVVSAKNDKTITVLVETYKKHPLYGKRVKYSKKYTAHDENNKAKEGDTVKIISTRPLSKTKRYELVDVLIEAVIL